MNKLYAFLYILENINPINIYNRGIIINERKTNYN